MHRYMIELSQIYLFSILLSLMYVNLYGLKIVSHSFFCKLTNYLKYQASYHLDSYAMMKLSH